MVHVVLWVLEGNPDGCPTSVERCPADDEMCLREPLACNHAKGEGPWTQKHYEMIEVIKQRTAELWLKRNAHQLAAD